MVGRVCVLSSVLAVLLAASSCGDSNTSEGEQTTSSTVVVPSSATHPNQVPSTTAGTNTNSSIVVGTSVPFDPDAPTDTGPVSISLSPQTVLSGGNIVAEYSTTPDGQSIAGRWERKPVAKWSSCDQSSCTQIGWLRIGAEPALLPRPPYDRAYLPYDTFGKDRPGGPDEFEVPADFDGLHQMCATLVSLDDRSTTEPCAAVTVRQVQTTFVGRPTAWFEVDPARPPRDADSSLNVLVHTVGCDRDAVVTDTQVTVSDTEIAISIGVEAVDCSNAIPASGPTPASVDLPVPIGDRAVLDVQCLGPFESLGHCTNERGRRWPAG